LPLKGQFYAYDMNNRPISVSGAVSANWTYDGNLKRVKEVRAGKTIYTLYSAVTGGPLPWPSPLKIDPPDRFFGLRPTGSEVYKDEVTDGKTTSYHSAGGVSVRLATSGGAVPPEWTHTDHLGSPIAATNAAGAVTWRESYTPWGEQRLKPPANDNQPTFTGAGAVNPSARFR
jgi:hypothetical protein